MALSTSGLEKVVRFPRRHLPLQVRKEMVQRELAISMERISGHPQSLIDDDCIGLPRDEVAKEALVFFVERIEALVTRTQQLYGLTYQEVLTELFVIQKTALSEYKERHQLTWPDVSPHQKAR